MNFDPRSFDFELDFRPPIMDPAMEGPPAALINVIAEQSIVQTIAAGSCQVSEISESGLRFVRYLMANVDSGNLPNFANPDVARNLARRFIQQAGSGVCAMRLMNAICEGVELSSL